MLDCSYPWRYYVGECLQNNYLPLWNPYQSLGYPVHADPQSSAWYPLVWIIGFFKGYNIYSISFEFFFHIYLAGVGMFLLLKELKNRVFVSLFFAASYMLSGFFIGNAQHLYWIISAAWIPFIFLYYIKFTKSFSYFHSLTAGFFTFLLITGGYPGFTIVLGYILVAYFCFKLYLLLRNSQKTEVFKLIKLNLVFLFSTLIFSSVYIISIYNVLPFMNRASSLSIEMTQFGLFSPQCSLSFFTPFAITSVYNFFDTDPSMANVYFGITSFVFFIFFFFCKKTRIHYFILLCLIICLLASFGSYTPFRAFLYEYIPFMNLFRFPALFRLFVIIFAIILSAHAMNTFMKEILINKKRISRIIGIFILFFLGLIICSALNNSFNILEVLKNTSFKYSEKSSLWEHIAFQSIIQIILLSFLFLVVIKANKIRVLLILFSLILVVDLVVASRLNEPYSVYIEECKSSEVKKYSEGFPKGFPLPDSTKIINHIDAGNGKSPLWRNMSIFHKRVAWDGFTSFYLKNYNYLIDSIPDFLKIVTNNQFAYFSSSINTMDSVKLKLKMGSINSKEVFFKSSDYQSVKSMKFVSQTSDSIYYSSFSPNGFTIVSKNGNQELLCILQSYFPGWTATVNNEKVKVYETNQSFMTIILPPGRNEIKFKYDSKSVKIGFYISLFSLIIFFLGLAIRFFIVKLKFQK
ncbi:MAG: YfhO family protein [Bacteroidetes bacterium]|nr:YfhO family protein [Bacteroidota bacterium]